MRTRGRSAFEGAQRLRVGDADAATAGGHEVLVSQRGESACDRFTGSADEFADLLLGQLHLGRTGSGRLMFGGELGEEVGNATRGVVDTELDAPAVSLA